MIKLTYLNGKEFAVNSDLIEFVESTPDTILTTTTGKKVVVSESMDELINKIIKFRRNISSINNAE